MKKLLLLSVLLTITSCTESVLVKEEMGYKLDTIYTYKVIRNYQSPNKSVKVIDSESKYKKGDVIKKIF